MLRHTHLSSGSHPLARQTNSRLGKTAVTKEGRTEEQVVPLATYDHFGGTPSPGRGRVGTVYWDKRRCPKDTLTRKAGWGGMGMGWGRTSTPSVPPTRPFPTCVSEWRHTGEVYVTPSSVSTFRILYWVEGSRPPSRLQCVVCPHPGQKEIH